MDTSSAEVERKVGRLAQAAGEAGVRGVLISAHWNFAWLTGGASNRIDITREAGAGALLVAADGRRLVLANAIEMPRLTGEALAGLDFEPVEFSWTDERADPALVLQRAVDVLGGGPVAADLPVGGALPFDAPLSRLRSRLEPGELARYRTLGADVGRAVGETLRAIRPGGSEEEVIRDVAAAVFRTGARPVVLLAAGDDRLLRHRHPLPTDLPWHDRLLVAVCAERGGLVAALSRLVASRPPSDEIAARLSAAQRVFGALLDASLPGASAARLFGVAAEAYAAEGFPGEEARHHQGGATGYRSREWLAHPRSQETVLAPAALAWNPSITGTKVEDTCLVSDAGIEMITATPGWPASAVAAQGTTIPVYNHLVLEP